MSYPLSRRRFLQASGVAMSLPFLTQLLTACQAVAPAAANPSPKLFGRAAMICARKTHS